MFLRAGIVIGALGLVGLGLWLPSLKTSVVNGLCYGIAALGVGILLRAGQISFGHAMYGCIAGYTVAFLARAYPALDGVVLAAAGTGASVVAGAFVGVFVVRYREIFFGMLNLAISMVLYSALGKLYEITGGTDGLRIDRPLLLGVAMERSAYETALLLATVAVAVLLGVATQRFFRSPAGEALAGIKTNETRLEYLGLSARRLLWTGYVLSAGMVGLAGAILVLLQGLVTPELGYWMRSGEFVFITILGGVGHALGAFMGAIVFESVKLFASAYLAGIWQLLVGATLILIIIAAPAGIVGLFGRRTRETGAGGAA